MFFPKAERVHFDEPAQLFSRRCLNEIFPGHFPEAERFLVPIIQYWIAFYAMGNNNEWYSK